MYFGRNTELINTVFYERMNNHEKDNKEFNFIGSMSGALPRTSFFDGTDSGDWECLVSDAHSGVTVRFPLRMAVWSGSRLYCSVFAVFPVSDAAPFSDGNGNGI